jgi:hypothetical protein
MAEPGVLRVGDKRRIRPAHWPRRGVTETPSLQTLLRDHLEAQPDRAQTPEIPAYPQIPASELDELAQPELWESEQEFQDFLADLYASRRSDIS